MAQKDLSYLHLSLQGYGQTSRRNPNDIMPIVKIISQKLDGHLTLIGVGDVQSSADLTRAFELGYDLVAVGRALVTEPRWLNLILNDQPVITTMNSSEWLERVVPKEMVCNTKINFPMTVLE
ncbi:hypothetical protein [Acinetobacter sp. MB5]|uniref:hypothetical protein n=1 Tax=Acinetobacter sp. MB5 TaxID=2069438 RepID=UPI0029E7FDA2|nr:hypothetical protein [Acinetobacter sp. MB5]